MVRELAVAGPALHYGEPRTLVQLLRHQADEAPERVSFRFLAGGEHEQPLTNAALDRQARAIAALLQAHGASGGLAVLIYPPGLEFLAAFWGCQYAGVVAIPAYAPNMGRPERSLPRLRAIVEDARPRVVLTLGEIAAQMRSFCAAIESLGAPQWLPTDGSLGDPEDWHEPALTPTAPAFIQYTSGSTRTPKGVVVTHRNLLRNLACLDAGWDHTPESVLVSWLPHFHDMGLIYGLLQPIFNGCSAVTMSPAVFVHQPLRWLEVITRYRGTHSPAPNFAYELCVRKTTAEERAGLDLSSWRMALNAAEPVRFETMERFATAFAPAGFRWTSFCPGYGLAEATLKVSATPCAAPPALRTVDPVLFAQHRVRLLPDEDPAALRLVGSGVPALDTSILIVEPERRVALPPGQVGEIWVGGSSVATGYWGRPDESAATFGATLDDGTGPFLRTGDLGFLDDGQLFVTGRLKDLIIIDGRNIYPQDVEQLVEASHPALRPTCSAAFALEVAGREELVVVAEVERQFCSPRKAEEAATVAAAIFKAVRRAVAEQIEVSVYDVVLLKVGTIPKTSSGKIQRAACREGLSSGELAIWQRAREPLTTAPLAAIS